MKSKIPFLLTLLIVGGLLTSSFTVKANANPLDAINQENYEIAGEKTYNILKALTYKIVHSIDEDIPEMDTKENDELSNIGTTVKNVTISTVEKIDEEKLGTASKTFIETIFGWLKNWLKDEEIKRPESSYTTPKIEAVNTSLIPAKITKVVDGDTFWCIVGDDEVKVRLIGIDTAESVHSDKNKNSEFGVMASDYTKEMLTDKTVYLQYDKEKTDKFDRELAYVWLNENVDTENELDVQEYMLNAILLNEGYALNKVYKPNIKYADTFERICDKAKENRNGLWEYEEFWQYWEK